MRRHLAPFVVLLLVGCSTLTPVQRAQTAEQKAYAAYATFVVYEEQAAILMGKPDVPDTIKHAIQQADALAKPAADVMLIAANKVNSVRAQLEDAPNDPTLGDKLVVSLQALKSAYDDAKPKIGALKNAIDAF